MKFTKYKYFLVISIIIFSFLPSQTREKNDDNSRSNPLVKSLQQSTGSLNSAIMDGPVDPKEYIVGPGDIFSVNIWSAVPLNFQVPVTPEGTVIIPTVSEIKVADLSLEEAKKNVLNEIRKKYLSGAASFTLYMPRTLMVTVRGAVKEEGKRFVQATQRIDMVVNYRKDEKEPIDTTIAQRGITVLRKDGKQLTVDIEKYYATRDVKYNPLLHDGDIILVPNKTIFRNFVSVYGAVNKQGSFEFVEGDSLLVMLAMARGLTKIADSTRVELIRFQDNAKTELINIDLTKIVRGAQRDIPLQRGDRIVVYDQYIEQRAFFVRVTGEVPFPGFYPISKDSTLLSEIVQRAGGITSLASLKNSQLYRRSVNWYEIAVERMESGRGGITPEDSAYYYLETDIRINRELVVTDFTDLIEKKNSSKDVLLRDGDEVHIASKKKTVYVFGQVVNPGHVLFESNKDINHYIAQSGGVTDDARSDIKIIKASTRQWLEPSKTTIEEGDYVWVPKEPYRPFSYYLTVYSQVFGIVATVVSLAILVTQ